VIQGSLLRWQQIKKQPSQQTYRESAISLTANCSWSNRPGTSIKRTNSPAFAGNRSFRQKKDKLIAEGYDPKLDDGIPTLRQKQKSHFCDQWLSKQQQEY